MKFFIAFNAEPLQLKFINFVLDRTDVDKNILMDAVKSKDEAFANAIGLFIAFQSELKKWGKKIGNSSNVFMECIYNQCAENDDSFKYVFGDKNDEHSYKKCYEHILNELYDAFKNSEEFSKEGRFMDRAKKVFGGFKNKNVALETLVKDMNQILVDNNKNSDEENDDRTIDEKEEDSWTTLEDNEVYNRGEWHVYRVDKYEDMRNVASKCSDWCVARKESGRSYFYGTYSPPYYLFTRGKRNPTILMHVDSQQFKGLDDHKFEADRPTSYDAIEIGKEFLEDLGELREHYYDNDDFSVFNEENSIEKMQVLDLKNAAKDATQEELLKMLDTTNDSDDICDILKRANDCEPFLIALDKTGTDKKSIIYRVVHMNILEYFNKNDQERIYIRILDELDHCESDFANDIAHYMVYRVDNEKVISTIIDKFGYGIIEKVLESRAYRTHNGAVVNELIKRNNTVALDEVMKSSVELSAFEPIVKKFANDADMMDRVIKASENKGLSAFHDKVLVYIVTHTEKKQIISNVIDEMKDQYDNESRIKLVKILWNKIDDEELERKLFEKCKYLKNNEIMNTMLKRAKTSDQKADAVSNFEATGKLQEYCDRELENLDYGSDKKMFFILIANLKDKKSIRRLVEKSGYDYELVSSVYRAYGEENTIDYDLIAKSIEKENKVDDQRALDTLRYCMDDNNNLIDNPYVTKIFFHIIRHSSVDRAKIINVVFMRCQNNEAKKEILRSFQNELNIYPNGLLLLSKSKEFSGLISEDTIKKCAEYAIEKLEELKIKDIILLPQCSNELAVEIASKCESRNMLYFALKKGAFGDGVEFVKNEMAVSSDKRKTMIEIMSALVYQGGNESDIADRITEYMLDCNLLSKNDKFDLINSLMKKKEGYGDKSRGMIIDYCINHWDELGKSLFEDMLKSDIITEEQARKLMDLWMGDNDDEFDSDAILGKASSTVRKVIEEYDKNGEIKEIDWGAVASNSDAMAYELMKAVEHIDNSEDAYSRDNQKKIYAILKHDNCTQEIAERAIGLIEFYEWDDTSRDDWGIIAKWIGMEVFEKTNEINTYSKLEDMVDYARNENELKKVLYALDWVGSDDDDGYDDDDEHDDDGGKEKVYNAIINNSNCSVAFFDIVFEEGKECCYQEGLVSSYLYTHTDIPDEQFVAFIEKYERLIQQSDNAIEALYKHKGLGGELFATLMKKFGITAVGGITSNKSISDSDLAEALEFVDTGDEKVMLKSEMASDITYRKALDLNVQKSCLEIIAERTTNEEIKNTALERINTHAAGDYGISALINKTSDDTELKRLVTLLYRKIGKQRVGYRKAVDEIANIRNPRALELMSKTKNQKILVEVISNSNASENTVLQILKKNPENEVLNRASARHEKSIPIYVCCFTKQRQDIERAFNYNARAFTSDDIMKMLRWNPSLKYDILKRAYFKLSNEQLASLKKLKDKDVDWIVDSILGKTTNNEKKSGRIMDRILKAERIARKILK